MNNNTFEDEAQHPMTRRRLAELFCPGYYGDKAVRVLRRWINKAELLKKELEKVGYKSRSREIFPPAIAILRKWFGDPFI